MKKTGLLVFVLIIAVSCLNEPDCYQLNNDTVVIYFKIIGGGDDDVRLTSIQSPETDSIFSNTTNSTIALPLNPKTEETFYTIHGVDRDNTLHFGYKRQVQFVSQECGERYYFQDLNVLGHDFDSIRIVNTIPAPTPLPTTAKNIEVYRCAITNYMGVSFNDSIDVEGITSDIAGVILQPPGAKLKDFLLPLNTNIDSTTYYFDLGDDIKTLLVRYTRTEQRIADICGDQILLSDLQINDALTDLTTVTVSNDSIQDLPIKNLDITP